MHKAEYQYIYQNDCSSAILAQVAQPKYNHTPKLPRRLNLLLYCKQITSDANEIASRNACRRNWSAEYNVKTGVDENAVSYTASMCCPSMSVA
jgi:hypothetical protein